MFNKKRWITACAVGLALVAIQLVRMWSFSPLNSTWAEDGWTFLNDAMHRGKRQSVLTRFPVPETRSVGESSSESSRA
jgi:hypothetical protein